MITNAQIAAVAAAYALGDDAAPTGVVARGEMGEVAQVRSSRGEFAVKRVFEPVGEGDVAEEVAFIDAVRAAGVLAPLPSTTTDGMVLLDVDGAQFRVAEWVDMAELDLRLDPAAVGETVARIHRCGFRGSRGEDAWYTEPVGAARWAEVVAQLHAARAPFADVVAALSARFVEQEALVEPARHLISCHRDLWADNVRATPSGRLCVFDWDNCGLAEPAHEVAQLLLEFGCGDAERMAAIHDAYVAAGGPGRVVGRGSFSMTIVQFEHIAELACRRWLAAAPESEARVRAEAKIDEFVERPFTIEMIDEMLAAVRG